MGKDGGLRGLLLPNFGDRLRQLVDFICLLILRASLLLLWGSSALADVVRRACCL